MCFPLPVPCSPGNFFNNTASPPRCDPCPLHYYQDMSEQSECKPCPTGTFTAARGSSGLEECKGIIVMVLSCYIKVYCTCQSCTLMHTHVCSSCATVPCAPGTASRNGLAPCDNCQKGFYQSGIGANVCLKCEYGQTTCSPGSTRKDDCG